LRCADTDSQQRATAGAGNTFNSLFEMPRRPPPSGATETVAFNSLFEMRLNIRVFLSPMQKVLSILYLRCRLRPRRLAVDVEAVLSILYLRCESNAARSSGRLTLFQFSI